MRPAFSTTGRSIISRHGNHRSPRFSNSVHNFAGPGDFLLGRRENQIDRIDLSRVNAQLPSEPQTFRAERFGLQNSRIVDIHRNTVQRRLDSSRA
jgi:hypothetical protein